MFQYRQILARMRQGDADRDIARARLMGRRKAGELRISADGTPVAVWVIPTNEELVVAREVKRFLEKESAASLRSVALAAPALQTTLSTLNHQLSTIKLPGPTQNSTLKTKA